MSTCEANSTFCRTELLTVVAWAAVLLAPFRSVSLPETCAVLLKTPNETAFTVTVTVKAVSLGVLSNTAQVSGNETDLNGANNTAAQATTVKSSVLQKVLLASQVLIGGCQNTTGNVYLTGPAGPGG